MKKLKRALCVVLAAILAFSMFSVNTFAVDVAEEDVVIVYGDVNKDGEVSLADAFMLLLSKLGFMSLDETQKFYGDVDADGNIDFTDIWLISKHCFGLIKYFPVISAAWPQGEETEDTHFLDACYKYDEETGLYEFMFDATSLTGDTAGTRSCYYAKGEKRFLSNVSQTKTDINCIVDEEGFYLLLPESKEYYELPIFELSSLAIYSVSAILNFSDWEYSGSTKSTVFGTEYICEEYTDKDTKYYCWFTVEGIAVRFEALSEDGYYSENINVFQAEVDDAIFIIPSDYIEREFDGIAALSYLMKLI